MAYRRELGYDPLTKVRSMFHDEGDGFITEERQDVTEILDANKAEFNEHDERTPWNKEINKVASIPLTVWEELTRKGIAQDQKKLLAWLDHPDNRAFRTRPGRLS